MSFLSSAFMLGSLWVGILFLSLPEHIYSQQTPDSIRFYNSQLIIHKNNGDSTALGRDYYNIAMAYDQLEKLDSALLYFNKAFKIIERDNNYELMGRIQNKLGYISLSWGNYQKALDHFLNSLKLYEHIGDSSGLSKAYNNIGVINHDWNNLEESLKYYLLSLQVDSLLGDVVGQAQTLNNIAILYDDMGKSERALNTYWRSLTLAEQMQDHYQIAVTNSNMGGVYIEEREFDLAEKHLKNTITHYKLANSAVGLAETDILFGDLYFERGEYQKASDYYNNGLSFALENKLSWTIMNAYYGLYATYEKGGDYKRALEYNELYHEISDSIFNINTSRQLALQANAYEIQKKDHEMEIQDLRLSEQKMKIARQQNIVWSLSIVILLFAIYTMILIRQYRLRIRAWRQLLSQHNEILKNRQELILAKEKAEESDRLKSAFLVNLSHELRTPMNGIMGFTDLLQKESPNEEQRQSYLGYIESSSKQLLKVLNDIIDISAIETNQLELSFEECSLHEIMTDLHLYFNKEKSEIEKHDLEIIYEAPEDAENMILRSDRRRLAQVIFNLLENALSFTTEGSITFGFKVFDNKIIRIYVSDTGIGIERSKFDVIFNRFRQVDDTTTRQHNGSGLGLAISRELLNLMGGTIYLESDLGRGTTFFVEIPCDPAK